MTSRVESYRADLRHCANWSAFLAANSNLPGPRANLELVAACGEEATVSRAIELIGLDDEFCLVCGLVALGRHFGAGDDQQLDVLYEYASDYRWRVREGVAMALQRACDEDLDRGFTVAEHWALDPNPLVQRAAVATVCEPRLLRTRPAARRTLRLLDHVTAELAHLPPARRRERSVRTLRQALGYGWSVAVAALPQEGLPALAALEASADSDVAWIVRENHRKARVRRLIEIER